MELIRNVTVVGAGVLGTQIAFHVAYKGFNVILYDCDPQIFVNVTERLIKLRSLYKDFLQDEDEALDVGLNNIQFCDSLSEALSDADLAIESVPENIDVKQKVLYEMGLSAPPKTIFATNSSTMLPSQLMEFTGRSNRFLALHFTNLLYRSNIVEVMGSLKTGSKIVDSVVEFSKNIGMYPVVLKKEQSGYVINSLLMPLLAAASELLIKGVADIETIDKTWKIATNSPIGPFRIYDFVGLNTIYNIAQNQKDIKGRLFAKYLKDNYIEKGKLGYLSGEGFYKYP